MTAFYAPQPYVSYRFVGDDALTFLQGQLTQDLQKITNNTISYAAYCDHKGQMFTNILVTGSHNDYVLMVHKSVADAIIKRLKMFVLRAKVTVEECDFQTYGVNAQVAESFCNAHQLSLPEKFSQCSHEDEYLLSLANDYYLLCTPHDIATYADGEDNEAIEQLRLNGGHFYITADTQGKIPPQQTPLSKWGISYQKGCYVGQEVISRMRYKGKTTKALGYGEFDTHLDLEPFAALKNGGSTAGQVIDYYHSDTKTYCLALVRIDALETTVTLNDQEATLTPISL